MGGGAPGDRGDGSLAPVVSHTSPLIGLERIGRLELLREVYGAVFVPPAVTRELGLGWHTEARAWIVERAIEQPADRRDRRIQEANLGLGEREAIALAVELGGYRVVLDDEGGWRLARALGLPVTGTLGVLVAAKRLSLLASVRPDFDALLSVGFYADPGPIEHALTEAGEAE